VDSTKRRSPLELLHPDGIALTSLVLGDSCPPGLEPRGPDADTVELVIVAGAELGPALQTAATRLAPDGILYVAAPPHRTAKAIEAAGLAPEPALLTLRGAGSRRLLVPAQAAAYALDQLVPAAGWRGHAARVAVRAGGARLLPHFAPGGILARRPGARPLHEWLRTLGGVDTDSAIVSWSDGSSLLVHAGNFVAKVGGGALVAAAGGDPSAVTGTHVGIAAARGDAPELQRATERLRGEQQRILDVVEALRDQLGSMLETHQARTQDSDG